MKENVCCFTGHWVSPQERREEIREATRKQTEKLILRGVQCFRVGGAVGYDTLAAQVLFELREKYPEIQVELYYPYEGFYCSWSAEEIEEYERLWPYYDWRICVCEAKVRPAYALPQEGQGNGGWSGVCDCVLYQEEGRDGVYGEICGEVRV